MAGSWGQSGAAFRWEPAVNGFGDRIRRIRHALRHRFAGNTLLEVGQAAGLRPAYGVSESNPVNPFLESVDSAVIDADSRRRSGVHRPVWMPSGYRVTSPHTVCHWNHSIPRRPAQDGNTDLFILER